MVASNPRAVPGHRERAEETDAQWAARWVVVLVVGCAASVLVSHGVALLAGRGSSEGSIGRLRGNQRLVYFGAASRPPSEGRSTDILDDVNKLGDFTTTPTDTTQLTRTVATRGLPVLTAVAKTSSHASTSASSQRACQRGLEPLTRGGLHGRLQHAGPGVNFTDKIGFRWFCSRIGAPQTPLRVV